MSPNSPQSHNLKRKVGALGNTEEPHESTHSVKKSKPAELLDFSHIDNARDGFSDRVSRRKTLVGNAAGRSDSNHLNGRINDHRRGWWEDPKNRKKFPLNRTAIDGTKITLPTLDRNTTLPQVPNRRKTLQPPVGCWTLDDERHDHAATVNGILNRAVIPPIGYDGNVNNLMRLDRLTDMEKQEEVQAEHLREAFNQRIEEEFQKKSRGRKAVQKRVRK